MFSIHSSLMLNVICLENLKTYLEELGYAPDDISEIISAYTSIIPLLSKISLRIYKDRDK